MRSLVGVTAFLIVLPGSGLAQTLPGYEDDYDAAAAE